MGLDKPLTFNTPLSILVQNIFKPGTGGATPVL
jgi:hypothetical protein